MPALTGTPWRLRQGQTLIFPDQTDEPALHMDAVRTEDTCLVGGIGGLERNRIALAAKPLEGRFLTIDERHNYIAVVCGFALADKNSVAVEYTSLDHRVALDFEREVLARPQHFRWDGDVVGVILDSGDRNACGDPTHDRHDGGTRRTVIGLAKKRGVQVIDRTITPDELATFSECFLVGTAAEVTPVSEIGEHKYKPGSICETLINDYSAAVQPKKVAAE